ncbi:hypothetical protein ACMFMG_009028 [Clarireedia jacksonii]
MQLYASLLLGLTGAHLSLGLPIGAEVSGTVVGGTLHEGIVASTGVEAGTEVGVHKRLFGPFSSLSGLGERDLPSIDLTAHAKADLDKRILDALHGALGGILAKRDLPSIDLTAHAEADLDKRILDALPDLTAHAEADLDKRILDALPGELGGLLAKRDLPSIYVTANAEADLDKRILDALHGELGGILAKRDLPSIYVTANAEVDLDKRIVGGVTDLVGGLLAKRGFTAGVDADINLGLD